ncbi:MAG: hypothetical protein IJ363_10725 [Clostridia bacterium]|nr:hypothetical protein [Clostridia bacterium]
MDVRARQAHRRHRHLPGDPGSGAHHRRGGRGAQPHHPDPAGRKEEITLNYVKGLSEKSSPITWEDLEKFRYDHTKASDSITWMLSVKGTDYELWISGVSTEKPPVYVYLYDMRTGDRLVIGEEDFDAFIEAHSK